MQALEKQQALAALREKIAGIVDLPPLHASVAEQASKPAASLLSLPGGLLHEIFTDDRRNSGAALGFALGSARGLLSSERLVVMFLQMRNEVHDVGVPYGPGLANFGFNPANLIIGRVETMTELLWAMEEAICCCAVAAVIVDIAGHPKILDFTASRRLSLRAASTGTSATLLRYGREREASAAKLRWHVQTEPSLPDRFDAKAVGVPRWRISLEKGRLPNEQTEFLLDWTKNGFELAEHDRSKSANRPFNPKPSLSGPAFAALGHRLFKAS